MRCDNKKAVFDLQNNNHCGNILFRVNSYMIFFTF